MTRPDPAEAGPGEEGVAISKCHPSEGHRQRERRRPVHPVADAFPMLGESELRALAEDIAEHGLHQPIVVQNGVVIDGRNRLAACEIAGVTAAEVELDLDQDPVAFILAANLGRRHMSKGAIAVSIAIAENAVGGFACGRKAELSSGFGISDRYLRMARTVVENDIVIGNQRCFADPVSAGSLSLREAYEETARSRTRTTPAQAQDDSYIAQRVGSVWSRISWTLGVDPDKSEGAAWEMLAERVESIVDCPPEAAVQAADLIDSLEELVGFFHRLVLEAPES